mmetsp:Transcript_18522/g.51696  ORF Transcript_18522/g.51696 Transcript_18522/m.51696 type:complete len:218 (-) Transcript_18522:246-899(-)
MGCPGRTKGGRGGRRGTHRNRQGHGGHQGCQGRCDCPTVWSRRRRGGGRSGSVRNRYGGHRDGRSHKRRRRYHDDGTDASRCCGGPGSINSSIGIGNSTHPRPVHSLLGKGGMEAGPHRRAGGGDTLVVRTPRLFGGRDGGPLVGWGQPGTGTQGIFHGGRVCRVENENNETTQNKTTTKKQNKTHYEQNIRVVFSLSLVGTRLVGDGWSGIQNLAL